MSEHTITLRHPKLLGLFALWLEQCAEGQVPLAAMLDPVPLRPWIGNLLVMDISARGQIVYSFYGLSLAEAFGDQQGLSLGEQPADHAHILRQEYQAVRRNRRPISRVYTAEFPAGRQTWERLVLPLADEADRVVKLLVGAYRLNHEPPTILAVPVIGPKP